MQNKHSKETQGENQMLKVKLTVIGRLSLYAFPYVFLLHHSVSRFTFFGPQRRPSQQPASLLATERGRRGGGLRLKIATAGFEQHHTSQISLSLSLNYLELVNAEICYQSAHYSHALSTRQTVTHAAAEEMNYIFITVNSPGSVNRVR